MFPDDACAGMSDQPPSLSCRQGEQAEEQHDHRRGPFPCSRGGNKSFPSQEGITQSRNPCMCRGRASPVPVHFAACQAV